MDQVFTMEKLRPIKDEMTISRDLRLSSQVPVTLFSLGKDTSISQETYIEEKLYIAHLGATNILIGDNQKKYPISENEILIVSSDTLCGMDTSTGSIYTEVILKRENTMNNKVKTNEVFALKDLIDYEEGSIANLDVVHNDTMKYVLMAFDAGTGLTPHKAPGNAIVYALDGEAIIGYEGKDYVLKAGECFRFEKNGLHSVAAQGKFKMALLLVLAE